MLELEQVVEVVREFETVLFVKSSVRWEETTELDKDKLTAGGTCLPPGKGGGASSSSSSSLDCWAGTDEILRPNGGAGGIDDR